MKLFNVVGDCQVPVGSYLVRVNLSGTLFFINKEKKEFPMYNGQFKMALNRGYIEEIYV